MADIQRYLNLVTSQHADKPKFMAWMEALLQKEDAITELTLLVNIDFDIDVAVGPQLDALGSILGVSRVLKFQPTAGGNPILIDVDYRVALKAKISQNQWDGTIGQIYELWDNIFPNLGLIIRDNQNMSTISTVLGASTQIQKDLVNNGYIVPKSAAVSMGYTFGEMYGFGYDTENTLIRGYDEGMWV
jgi:hypothetical protein